MFYLRVFTRNHLFQVIHGDICATILNFGDESISEWNLCQMEHVLHSMDVFIEVSERFWYYGHGKCPHPFSCSNA